VIIRTVDRLLGRPEGASEKLITYVTDRAGHDLRYAIDSRKLKEELGWEPSLQFEEGIEKTVRWYLANQEWMDDYHLGGIRAVLSGNVYRAVDAYFRIVSRSGAYDISIKTRTTTYVTFRTYVRYYVRSVRTYRNVPSDR